MEQLNEIKRMQKLAGINEIKIDKPISIKNLSNQAIQELINKGNQYTEGMKEELLNHFEIIGDDIDGIKDLKDIIKKIKSGELTNDDIVYDMIDSYGGDYEGEFEGYRF